MITIESFHASTYELWLQQRQIGGSYYLDFRSRHGCATLYIGESLREALQIYNQVLDNPDYSYAICDAINVSVKGTVTPKYGVNWSLEGF
jgi:hypothetical protein